MTRLSIVIPCLGPCEQFEDTLVSVLQNRPEDCEILVATSESYTDPYRLRDEVQFTHLRTRCLVDLINDALQAARGEVIHLLACGTEVREGWTQPALRHFADPSVAAVSPLVLRRDAPGKMETMGVRYRAGGERISVGRGLPIPDHRALADSVLAPSLLAGFYSRDVLLALGGFSHDVGDELADVDLGLALCDLDFRAVLEPKCQVVAGAVQPSFTRRGALGRGIRAESLFWRHWGREGRTVSSLAHPLALIVDAARQQSLLAAGLKLLGHSLGLLSIGTSRAYEQQLAAAAAILGDQEAGSETLSLEAAREELKRTSSPAPARRRAA